MHRATATVSVSLVDDRCLGEAARTDDEETMLDNCFRFDYRCGYAHGLRRHGNSRPNAHTGEKWTPAGNPYLIFGDIIIPACRKHQQFTNRRQMFDLQ
jgi:hypothetical protein